MLLVEIQPDLPLGVHTLHPSDSEMSEARALGARYVVQVFAWNEIEPSPGEFHWEYTDWLLRAADYYKLHVIARLDDTPKWAAAVDAGVSAPPRNVADFTDFVWRVASRYKGRIDGYVVWNEPNLAREWGGLPPDPAGYAGLLRAAAKSLRSADPSARIVSAGLAPTNEHSATALDDRDFLKALYAAGGRESFDVLGAHPYPFDHPPEDSRGAHDGLNLARLQDLRDIMVANGDSSKPVWITEFGYTTSPPAGSNIAGVTEDQQAAYVARAYEFVRENWDWVKLLTVWNLSAGLASADEKAGYSLLRPDGTHKPALASVRNLPKDSIRVQAEDWVSEFLGNNRSSAEYPVLARDALVHLGDSDYPLPWVPLYLTRNPSTIWQGEFYLREADLAGARRNTDWRLTMELMQANDLDSRVLVNGQSTNPEFLHNEDFTGIWVTDQFAVAPSLLHVGPNVVTLLDGKLFPAFQQSGFTWDDFQVRNVILTPP